MATCPNCGEIVMNGDPYCTNCGTTFRWYFDDEDEYEIDEEDNSQDLIKAFDLMLNSNLTSREKFDLFREYIFMPDYMLD